MKKHKVLVILGIVLIIFLAGYGLLKWNEYRTTEFIEDKEVSFVGIQKEAITKIQIQDKQNFTLVSKKGTWVEEGVEKLPYNQELLNKLVNELLNLKSIQVISNIQDKTAYGITEGAMTVTLFGKAEQVATFKVGNYGSAKDGMYVWDATKELIYVVPKKNMEMILMPKGELIDPTFKLPTLDKINSLVIKNSKETVALKRNPKPNGQAGYEVWSLEKPFKAVHAVKTEGVTLYGKALEQFSKDKLVAYNKDKLADYGLDTPSLVITINDATELSFGNDDGGYTYFMSKEEPYIYGMSTDKLQVFFDTKPFDMICKEVYVPKLEDVMQIQVVNPNKTYDILLNHGIEQEKQKITTSTINDSIIDEAKTKEIFDLLTALCVEAPLVNPGLEEREERTAEITITYTLKDGKTKLIELIPFDTSVYILRIEGNVEFVVGKAPVMNIFNTLSTILKKDAK